MAIIDAVLQTLKASLSPYGRDEDYGVPLEEIAGSLLKEGAIKVSKDPTRSIQNAINREIRIAGRTSRVVDLGDGSFRLARLPNPDFFSLESLRIYHDARMPSASGFKATDIFSDYYDFTYAHRFRVGIPCEDLDVPCGPACSGDRCTSFFPVAQVIINEFPHHILGKDEWLWIMDAAEQGPTAALGGMIDSLLREDRVEFSDELSGAILHVQNLEVHPDFRRRGVGGSLLRHALTTVSRTSFDLAVLEYGLVQPPFPPLFQDPDHHFPGPKPLPPSQLTRFMGSVGFALWSPEPALAGRIAAMDMIGGSFGNMEAPLYYLPLDEGLRIYWARGRSTQPDDDFDSDEDDDWDDEEEGDWDEEEEEGWDETEDAGSDDNLNVVIPFPVKET